MNLLDNEIKIVTERFQEKIKLQTIILTIISSLPPLGKSSAINQEHLYTCDELVHFLTIIPPKKEEFKKLLDQSYTSCDVRGSFHIYYSLPKLLSSVWFMEAIVPLTHYWPLNKTSWSLESIGRW